MERQKQNTMKKILILCLLSMALLLPSTTITAKEFSKNNTKTTSLKRIVDVTIIDEVLSVTSDASTGTLVWVKVYNTQKQLVLAQLLSGYSDGVDVSFLHSGMYSVTVHTSLTNYSENIYL